MQQFLALLWAMITTVFVAPVRILHSTITSVFSTSTYRVDRPDQVPKWRLLSNAITAMTITTSVIVVFAYVLTGSPAVAVISAIILAVTTTVTYIAVNVDVGAAHLNSMLGKNSYADKSWATINYFTIGTMIVVALTVAAVLGAPITVFAVIGATGLLMATAVYQSTSTSNGQDHVDDKKWLKFAADSGRDVGDTFNLMSLRQRDRRHRSCFGLPTAT